MKKTWVALPLISSSAEVSRLSRPCLVALVVTFLITAPCALARDLGEQGQPPISAPSEANAVGPCADPLYLKLRSKDIEALSRREYETYRRKDQACLEAQRRLLAPADVSAPALPSAADPALWRAPSTKDRVRPPFGAGAVRAAFGGWPVFGGGSGFGVGGRLRGDTWPVAMTAEILRTEDRVDAGTGDVRVGAGGRLTEIALGASYGLYESSGSLGVETQTPTRSRVDVEGGISVVSGKTWHYVVDDDGFGDDYRDEESVSQPGIWIGTSWTLQLRRLDLGVVARGSSASITKYSLGSNGIWFFAGMRFGATGERDASR